MEQLKVRALKFLLAEAFRDSVIIRLATIP